MFRINVGEYEIACQSEGLPDMLPEYRKHAVRSDEFTVADNVKSVCFVSVGLPRRWPSLVVTQWYSPSGGGYFPGALLIPESHRILIGAGRRLLAYDLLRPAPLWEDETDCGFWSWERHGQVVLMSAETELAAWDVCGNKLWSRFVEPPWDYTVAGKVVIVDVMGVRNRIMLLSGQPEPA